MRGMWEQVTDNVVEFRPPPCDCCGKGHDGEPPFTIVTSAPNARLSLLATVARSQAPGRRLAQ
jgi:hypothetical protein